MLDSSQLHYSCCLLPMVSHKCVEALGGVYDRAWLLVLVRSRLVRILGCIFRL